MSLDASSQLGQTLANSANETQTVKENLTPEESNAQAIMIIPDTIKLRENIIKVAIRDVSTDSIYDFDYWDNCNWEGDYDNLAIIKRVIHPNNSYKEYFKTIDFIDNITSTATINTVTNFATVNTTAFLQSNIVYCDGSNISQAKISVEATVPSNLLIYGQNTNSTNWETFSNGLVHSFITSGSELKYKIKSSNGSINITKIEIIR